MKKIAIVGAGRVGEAAAQVIINKELCRELGLFDIRPGVPEGVALDLAQTAPLLRFDCKIQGSNNPEILQNSDLVIITAGIPRQPGMSRLDVLETNVRIIDTVTEQIQKYAPDALILVVSNPVDTLTYRVAQRTGWGQARVFGQAGVLDAARMASFIAHETGFANSDITTFVLGGHGDTMVPLPRLCTIQGIPLSQFLSEAQITAIIERTRHGGAEILALRKNSSAYDAPGAAVAIMVDAIARQRRRILPCVVLLNGEYGETDLAMGVPCILGDHGVERVIELPLNDQERADFQRSVAAMRQELACLSN